RDALARHRVPRKLDRPASIRKWRSAQGHSAQEPFAERVLLLGAWASIWGTAPSWRTGSADFSVPKTRRRRRLVHRMVATTGDRGPFLLGQREQGDTQRETHSRNRL